MSLRFLDDKTAGPAWPDLDRKNVTHVQATLDVVALAGGMTSGKPSVCIRLDLPDGRVVLAETSAALFCAAGSAIGARFPELGG
jgi:hypothetical protein